MFVTTILSVLFAVSGPDAPMPTGAIDAVVPENTEIVELVEGSLHTCALLDDGRVVCVGDDGVGQLGRGGGTGPVVPLAGPAVELVAGYEHTCALLDGGTITCWGLNHLGQLGLKHTDVIGDDETPARQGLVALPHAAVAVFAQGDHTCAILDDGSAHCWGDNREGIFGYGTLGLIGDDETPVEAGAIPIDEEILSITIFDDHTCLETVSGENPCAGKSWNGKINY